MKEIRVFFVLAILVLENVLAETTCKSSSKMDLQFIVDSSLSVGEDHFHNMMKGIADEVEKLDIGEDKTRVGLVRFSTQTDVVITLGSIVDKIDLIKQIRETEYVEGATFTGTAMRKALENFAENDRDDKDAVKLCLVFTDGVPTTTEQRDLAKAETIAWADNGIKVYAVGIGDGIDEQGLKDIAGSKDRVLEANDFEEVGATLHSLMRKVCDAVPAGYTKRANGLYYKKYDEVKSWAAARDTCKGDGGLLAVVKDELSASIVRDLEHVAWINANDIDNEGNWVTSTGELLTYRPWNAGEPNGGRGANCAMQYNTKKWDDYPCTTKQKFVCQFSIEQENLVPEGYTKESNGIFYKKYDSLVEWNQAKEVCSKDGGELAVISNANVAKIVHSYVNNPWIGATDAQSEGHWKSAKGSSLTYTNWNGGEPNGGTRENCVEMLSSKKWNDLPCNIKKAFVCQFTDSDIHHTMPAVPAGYTLRANGLYYKKYNEDKSWTAARDTCNQDGGQLAVVNDELSASIVHNLEHRAWINANDINKEGNWVTSTGKFLSYHPWNAGEPNGGRGANCAMQYNTKKWDDYPCTTKQKFVCQFSIKQENRVPEGYTKESNGIFYKKYDSLVEWNQAKEVCSQDRGELAVISNANVAKIVHGYVNNPWIGATDSQAEGHWKSAKGSSLTYTNWNGGEPNGGTKENCVEMLSSKKWNDLPCNIKKAFVCQFTDSALSHIPVGYLRGSNKIYYRKYDTKSTWPEARETCKQSGGELVVIYDDQAATIVTGYGATSWTGGNDRENEGHWVSSRGESLTYFNWNGGEPNGGRAENCVQLLSNKKWNDWSCTNKQKFVCQYREGVHYTMPAVPAGYALRANGLYYKRYDSKVEWIQARDACAADHGELAVIYDTTTANIVHALDANPWIASNDIHAEGQWVDTKGVHLTYTNWNGGEPNGGRVENCVELLTSKKWNDLPCTIKKSYVCQFGSH